MVLAPLHSLVQARRRALLEGRQRVCRQLEDMAWPAAALLSLSLLGRNSSTPARHVAARQESLRGTIITVCTPP
jgi:hypothetical protein